MYKSVVTTTVFVYCLHFDCDYRNVGDKAWFFWLSVLAGRTFTTYTNHITVTTPTPQPHHNHTTLTLNGCGVGVVSVWCGCGVGVVWLAP